MILLRPGNHAYLLFSVLSVTGEYPFRSLQLLGNDKVMQQLVHKLTTVQTIRNISTGEELTAATVRILGKSSLRTIRFAADASTILRWLDAEMDYENAFPGARLPNDIRHRERNHRVAEAVALCATAGIEYRPHLMPQLQCTQRISNSMDTPLFYTSRAVKNAGNHETSKTSFSRIVGGMVLGGIGYAVYNARNAEMKWNFPGEQKVLYRLNMSLCLNFPCPQIDSAVLFGSTPEKVCSTLISTPQSYFPTQRLDAIFHHIYFVPANDSGVRFLKIMALPRWQEHLLKLSFPDASRSYGRGTFEYDAFINGVYFISHLDCDLARLYRFRDATQTYSGQFKVLCYSHQVSFLREFLGPEIGLKAFPMEYVEQLLFPNEGGSE